MLAYKSQQDRLTWTYSLLLLLIVGQPSLAFGQPSSSEETCQGPLFRAIHRGDAAEVDKLIDAGVNLNFRACTGNRTPLMEVIVRRFEGIPKRMILAGADPNLTSDNSTPLLLATWYCRKDLVSLMLERGALVDGSDRDGNTPLIAAPRCTDDEIAMKLLKAGASVNVRTKRGATALTTATLYRKDTLVRELIAAGAEMPSDPKMAELVRKATSGKGLEPADLEPSVRDGCGNPLLAAIYKRDLGEIDRITGLGSGLNFKGCESGTTPLIEAIGEGLPEVAAKLIMAGASVNLASDDGTTPLMMASWYQRKELVSLMLQREADVNALAKNGDSALIPAAQQSRDGETVDLLIRAGADVNIRTKYGSTPLSVATFYGNERAVKLLVAAGADLDAKTDEGTPLEIARDRVVGRTEAHDRIYAFLLEATKRRPRS